MSIEETIKDLEHTIKYFEGCADKFQRGRKYQAMRTLEQLHQYNVVERNEQSPPKYTPCGGCGADNPNDRCINCFHDFGGN